MAEPDFAAIESQFRLTLEQCEELYLSAARDCCQQHPNLVPGPPQDFLQRMGDLHKGLLIKIFASVSQADRRFGAEEARLAAVLLERLWHESLGGIACAKRRSTSARRGIACNGTASCALSINCPRSRSVSPSSKRSSSAWLTCWPSATAS